MTLSNAFGGTNVKDAGVEIQVSTREEFSRRLMERFHISYSNYEAIRSLVIPATSHQTISTWDESSMTMSEDEILFDKAEGRGLTIDTRLIRRYYNLPEEAVKELKQILKSDSPSLDVSISNPEVHKVISEEFPGAYLNISSMMKKVYPNRTAREYFERKLDFEERIYKDNQYLLSLTKEQLIEEFSYGEGDLESIFLQLLSSSENLQEALSTLDLSTNRKKRALIFVLHTIIYHEKQFQGLDSWKRVVKVYYDELKESGELD